MAEPTKKAEEMEKVIDAFNETCEACEKSFKDYRVDSLREAKDKALRTYGEANIAYLTARDAYHKDYRSYWAAYESTKRGGK